MGDRRTRITTGIAVIAHVAVFLAARQVVVPPVVVVPAVTADVEIDVVPETTPTAVTSIGLPSAPAPRAITAAAAVATAAPPEATPAPVTSATPEPVTSAGTLVVFGPSLGISGTGQINPFLGRGALPPATAPPPGATTETYIPEAKRAEQAVKDAVRARDVGLGLGPEGPIVHALEDATHASAAPSRGGATFLAVIDERGIVVDLRVLTVRGGRESGWEDVRARAAKALVNQKVDLRGIKRAEMRIAVDSDVRLPSGTDPNKAPVQPVASASKIGIQSNAPGSPGGADVVQAATVATFDVADIGAKPTRIVHARLVSLTTL